MESKFTRTAIASLIGVVALLAGCATPSARNFHGPWKPVNRYAVSTTAIPLAKTYMFFATPMDGTLKTMLSRWSKDTGIKLSYDVDTDYTLPEAVAQIDTSDAYIAASQLNKIYAPQRIAIAVRDWQIEVRAVDADPPRQATADAKPSAGSNAGTQR